MKGHGWIRPNPEGIVARCGGPGLCVQCTKELDDLPAELQIRYFRKIAKEGQRELPPTSKKS